MYRKQFREYLYQCSGFNPLNSQNDQHLVSPYNNTAESFIQDHENKGNNHQLKRLLIVKQILLVNTLGNVWRTVWRIYILMLGCKGLRVKVVSMKFYCTI